jgi:hypothetical protein
VLEYKKRIIQMIPFFLLYFDKLKGRQWHEQVRKFYEK